MTISVLFFGISTELSGEHSVDLILDEKTTVETCISQLLISYPKLKNMSNFAVAINEIYAEDHHEIKNGDVIAILPPVSGG